MAANKRIRKHLKADLPKETPTGIQKVNPVITVIDYSAQSFQEKKVKTIEECFAFKATPTVTWINIDGINQIDTIEKIGKNFKLHPLIIEYVFDTGQRPKFEDYDNSLFAVLKMLTYDDKSKKVVSEQVSLVVGDNFVISFQENPGDGDVFGPVRDRIRNDRGRIRKMPSDYLFYSLIDAVVDNYFAILEKIDEHIEEIEEELITKPSQAILTEIYTLKRELIFLRKSVWPLRELISSLEKSESELIKPITKPYLRDVYYHTVQVIDTVEAFRDMVSGMFDIYLSSVSNRMNSIMKVLTIIGTIFIPLTFVVGVYGMNFENFPELRMKWAYPTLWVIMISIAAFMLAWFKRKKWL